jgi:histidinol-phosphate aminotransferase
VIVRPVAGYGFPTHLRITIGTARENETCVAALKAVLGA